MSISSAFINIWSEREREREREREKDRETEREREREIERCSAVDKQLGVAMQRKLVPLPLQERPLLCRVYPVLQEQVCASAVSVQI